MNQFRRRSVGAWLAPLAIEAEQVRISVIPMELDGSFGFMARRNPFDALVMRRPRWFKRKVPMLETAQGWQEVHPTDWICRQERGGFHEYWIVAAGLFEERYEQISNAGNCSPL